MLALLFQLRGVSTLYFAFGILGSVFPEALSLTALTSLTVYGRLLGFGAKPGAPPTAAPAMCSALNACSLAKSRGFTIFYIVGAANCGLALYLAHTLARLPLPSVLLLAAFTLHVARRLGECFFLHVFSAEARMPLHLVAFGALHYVFAPWALLALPTACSSATPATPAQGAAALLPALATTLGALLFTVAFAAQAAAHLALARLPRGPPPRRSYPLPTAQHSALFSISLCPHYTAEIALYCGLLTWREGAVALLRQGCQNSSSSSSSSSGSALTALGSVAPHLLLGWTVCNLAITGGRLKAWYITAYPNKGVENRYAVLPYVY